MNLPLNAGIPSPATYELLTLTAPERIEPGGRFQVQGTFQLQQPGAEVFRRPSLQFQSKVPGDDQAAPVLRIPITPWQWPETQATGDQFAFAAEIDVPMTFPAGPAELVLRIGHVQDRHWTFANLIRQGQPTRNLLRHPVQIAPASVNPSAPIPLVIPRMAPPPISGPFDPEAWSASARIQGLSSNRGGNAPQADTTVWLGHDGNHLFLAAWCQEPAMHAVHQRDFPDHDSAIWNNESIQLFVAAADRQNYVQLILDLLNQRYDALGSDTYGYNPPWESSIIRGDDHWIARLAIPMTALAETAPAPGERWYANVARERWAEREVTAWQPTDGSLLAPGKFGIWVFDSLRESLLQRSASLRALDLEALRTTSADATRQWEEQLGELEQHVQSLDESHVLHTYADLEAAMDRLATAFSDLRAQAARESGSGYLLTRSDPYDRFEGHPHVLDQPAGPIQIHALRQEWADVAWNIQNMTDRSMTLRFTLRQGDASAYSDIGQWDSNPYLRFGLPGIESIWSQALPVAAGDGVPSYDVITPRPDGVVQIAPGQTTQVWLSLQPTLSAAAGSQTGVIRIEAIDTGSEPPRDLPLNLEVIPEDLKATRSIHVFMWNQLPPEVTSDPDFLELHLQDLLDHGVSVTSFRGLRNLPRVRATPAGELKEKLTPEHFLQTDRLWSALQDRFDYYYLSVDIWEKGRLRRDLIGLDIDDPAYEKAFKIWLREVLAHLMDLGMPREKLLLSTYDENIGPRSLQIARWIKEVDPSLKIIQNSSPGWQDDRPPAGLTPEQLMEYQQDQVAAIDAVTDYWMPHQKYFFPESIQWFYERIRSQNKPLWAYYYAQGSNEKHQHPTRQYLSRFWWAYQERIGGLGWWAMQYYGDPWSRANGNRSAYDTSLVYPADGALIPSRRWQAWRRGWQDHTLLSIARHLLEVEENKADLQELDAQVRLVVARPGDAALAEQVRSWAKQQIRRLTSSSR